jgi:predicted small metal-binding protein
VRAGRPVKIRHLRCRRLNGKRCGFVAKGRTVWEVKKAMFDHEAKEHRELLLDADSKYIRETMDKMDRLMDKNKDS